MKQEYTEKIHAFRLIMLLLDTDDPEIGCPAAEDMLAYNDPGKLWSKGSDPCKICVNFVGHTFPGYDSLPLCPCHLTNKDDAIKRSWKALEDKGYLKTFKLVNGVVHNIQNKEVEKCRANVKNVVDHTR